MKSRNITIQKREMQSHSVCHEHLYEFISLPITLIFKCKKVVSFGQELVLFSCSSAGYTSEIVFFSNSGLSMESISSRYREVWLNIPTRYNFLNLWTLEINKYGKDTFTKIDVQFENQIELTKWTIRTIRIFGRLKCDTKIIHPQNWSKEEMVFQLQFKSS